MFAARRRSVTAHLLKKGRPGWSHGAHVLARGAASLCATFEALARAAHTLATTMSQSLLDNWSDEGCAAAISEAAASPADPSAPNPLKVVLHDLSSAVVRGALEPERLVTVLSDAALVDRALLPRVQSDLADIFWFLGLRIEAEKSDEDGDGAPKQQLLALSLIGYFDLDPNRVLDLALEAVPSRASHRSLYLPHVLGFKFQFYKGEAEAEATPAHSSRAAEG
ncbi:hypothetical protein EMIHUDRAFT_208069 [Emiliania huxleyi CCMP1516]|uniref:Uncharacterized protein n=2 Tax=Emiliania huxleyi TaxID=2903 RepID=A0A0D3JBV8_EMIH1|nr:hypothetical protein EMIHUDRAFT_208069 [Emiliania huxleyi CCMP1516]EOD20993.1 hypothetical protein EMIHUDRAFT_208069 [Emiliania huxleyi CCMP1516]|eukprot:XP_005773422.1 hypothetical protein EMIHUDRAFT_208069 [Emiliania huxleyi CCMP1516]